MSDPSITTGTAGKTSVDYTPVTTGDAGKPQQVGGTAATQNDGDLTVTRQSDQLAAAQAAGLVSSDDLAPPKTLGDLSLAVAILFADLSQTEAKNTEDTLDHTGKQILENNQKRMEQVAKMAKLLAEHKKKQSGILAGEICGIIGGALVAGLSLGTLGPVGATMMVASVAVATATQVTQMTGGFDAIAKSDPKLAQGLMYTGIAVSAALALGTGGASLINSFTSTGEAAAMAGETAAETGAAMSEAATSAEAADALVEGVSEMTTTTAETTEAADVAAETATDVAEAPTAFSDGSGSLADGGTEVTEDAVVDTEAAEAATQDVAEDAAEGADDAASKASQQGEVGSDEGAETTTEEAGDSNWQKAANIGRRTGQALKLGSEIEQGETQIELGINQKQQDHVQARIMRIDADNESERAIQKELAEAAADILDALNSAFKFMGTHEQTLTKTRQASITAIGQAADPA